MEIKIEPCWSIKFTIDIGITRICKVISKISKYVNYLAKDLRIPQTKFERKSYHYFMMRLYNREDKLQ